jgi:hypothetical protein
MNQSVKEKRWFRRNNFEDNQEYTEKVLQRFNINKYHFAYDAYGVLSLLVENGLKKYKVIVNQDICEHEIYRCDVHVNFSKYTKENMVLKKKFNDDCIWNSIKWISKDSSL